MTILQRTAAIAVMTFSLAGLLGHSTPGLATGIDRAEINRMAITTPALATINPSTDQMVPARAMPAVVETLPAIPAPVSAPTPEPSFETLDAAVSAQDVANVSDEAVNCLAGAIYFESKGEPLSGQLAVAEVILNRAQSGRYPSDVCDVVTQRGQFSFVRGGRIPAISMSKTYRTALAVAKVALADAWQSAAPKAMFFNTPDRRPGGRLTKIASIGNHVFYR